MGKKILGIPKHHANLCPLIALGWPSMRLRILKRKLMFLLRLTRPDNSSISAKSLLDCQGEWCRTSHSTAMQTPGAQLQHQLHLLSVK